MPLSPQQATDHPCLHRSSNTHKAGLAQSFMGSLLLSPGSWYAQDFFVCVPSRSLFPWVLWQFCNQIPLSFKVRFSLQFSLSVVSDSLGPHGLQHARLPCPSPTHGDYSKSCPWSWWCHPTISVIPFLLRPSIFPSTRLLSKESVLHIRWPKYSSFSFNISPSNEYSGLISFRIDWLGLLTVQKTLKSLQHHRSKASIPQCSAFFIV